jgi:hypothetical protein
MNENKLESLFDAARKEAAPMLPPDFAADVLRAVRRAPVPCASAPFSLCEQLNFLFPRLALVLAAVIILCAVGNFMLPGADDEMVSAEQNFGLEDL